MMKSVQAIRWKKNLLNFLQKCTCSFPINANVISNAKNPTTILLKNELATPL